MSQGPRRREGRQGPQPSAPTLIAYARARALSLLATKVCRLLPAVNCTCLSTSVHRLPRRCSLLAAKVCCCRTGPTLSPRPAPLLPSPLPVGASHSSPCMSVQHRRRWAKSQCHSLSPSLPPAPLRLPRPPPPASACLALLRRPAPASPSSAGQRRRRPCLSPPASTGPRRPRSSIPS